MLIGGSWEFILDYESGTMVDYNAAYESHGPTYNES